MVVVDHRQVRHLSELLAVTRPQQLPERAASLQRTVARAAMVVYHPLVKMVFWVVVAVGKAGRASLLGLAGRE